MEFQSIPLTSNWTFKQGDATSHSEYLPANDLPTEVHRDLFKNEKIADPFIDLNELSVRWIADETWTYKTAFSTPQQYGKPGCKSQLKFEGLDTYASVSLNGKPFLQSDNMFVEHVVSVDGQLKENEDNELVIVFASARQEGLALVKKHTEHRFIVHQTEISRGPVRKAQYHWGWDWGPLLLTCGPWKPIYLESYHEARLDDVWVEYQLDDNLKKAKGKVFVRTTDGHASKLQFQVKHSQKDGVVLERSIDISRRISAADSPFDVDFDFEPELWWPRGYGSQTLYTVAVSLKTDEQTSHQIIKTIGFRKVELVQEDDDCGRSFYFRVNNVDIFAGGSCWIPADSFVSSISPSRYRNWVKLAAEGNQIMLRIWGGGIYEADAFYEACDELGILVWQDFMFACANYPAYPEYLKSVELEATQNVRRLRNHPSIIVWAGNNEDYQIVERYSLQYDVDNKDLESWLKTDFPARYIYEHLLPKIVKEETKGSVLYHPSSPFGNGKSTVLKVDPTIGDIHQWNVWHGDMKPYQLLPEMGGRFVSEFGMEAYPHLETLEQCISREEDRYPGSMAMDFRNKAIGHERRLVSYVAENFRIKYDLPSFTHLTQVMQADAMSWAYKSWRRQWGTKGKRQCGGVLVWQLNDCWPTMSWAVVDYYGVPKPAYYAIKRAMEPVVVGVTRKFHNWTMRPADDLWQRDTSQIDMRKIWEDVEFDVWVSSNRLETLQGTVNVKFISIKTGDEVLPGVEENVTIEANATTEVLQKYKPKPINGRDRNTSHNISQADPYIIYVTLNIDDKVVSSDVSWPDPIKYLNFEDRGIEVKLLDNGSTVTVIAAKPVKGFTISERKGMNLTDNGFDIVPGCSKKIDIRGCSLAELKWYYVGM